MKSCMLPKCVLSLLALGLLGTPPAVLACPFCNAVSLTFSEEMNSNDVAVIARLMGPADPEKKPDQTTPAAGTPDGTPPAGADPQNRSQFTSPETAINLSYSIFQVEHVLKGSAMKPKQQFKALYFGKQPPGTYFLLMGNDPPKLNWGTPIPLTKRSVEYMLALPKLPTSGAERLAFFMKHLEDEEELLKRDAYDEFAKAPYATVKSLAPHMSRQQLLAWIKDAQVSTSHRRLYLTMLGVCGKHEDAALLEQMLTAKTEEPRSGLDATIACYLTLKGPDGLNLIEKLFLANPKAEYTDTYAAIMAIRFHGQEEKVISRERLLESLRHMLDRPQLADLVIPDLARWEDWSVMDKLVDLFKNSDEKSSWVRVPVVQYLQACPLPEAKLRIAELQKIDPESVRRASFFLPLGPPKKAPETPAAPPAKATGAAPGRGGATKPSAQPAPPANAPQPSAAQQPKQAQGEARAAAATSPAGSRWAVGTCLVVGLGILYFGLRGTTRR
jgi:hypothetical protein